MRRVLAQTALLVNWLYGIPLSGVLCSLVAEERAAASLADKAMSSLLQSSMERNSAGKRLDGLRHACYLFKLALPLSGIIKGMLIKYSDFKELSLPDRLFWLYFQLRPLFWLWRNYLSPKKKK
jgi:hypothetical protein